jgi:hypothetical protein
MTDREDEPNPATPKPISLSVRKPVSLSEHRTVAASGRPKLEEWVKGKVEQDSWREILGLLHEFETALKAIAQGRVKGYERSHAGERLRAIYASLDARFNKPS